MNQNTEIYFAFIFFHINLVFLSHLWKDIMISSMFSSSIFLFQKDFCGTFLHILAAFFHDILLLLPFDYLNDNNFLNILLFFLCVYHYTLFCRSFFGRKIFIILFYILYFPFIFMHFYHKFGAFLSTTLNKSFS